MNLMAFMREKDNCGKKASFCAIFVSPFLAKTSHAMLHYAAGCPITVASLAEEPPA